MLMELLADYTLAFVVNLLSEVPGKAILGAMSSKKQSALKLPKMGNWRKQLATVGVLGELSAVARFTVHLRSRKIPFVMSLQ